MMNELQIFNNPDFGDVRTIIGNDKVLFCGTDVAIALGYTNPQKAVNDHCRCLTKRSVPHPQSPNKEIEMNFLPEGDVYRLIIASKLPTAEKFEKWVFDEVLPSIRKHGAYLTPKTTKEWLQNPGVMIQALQELQAEMDKVKEQQKLITAQNEIIETQNNEISEMKPKVSYYDIILACKAGVPITLIAKDYGKSAVWLNEFLSKHKIQYKMHRTWVLYSKYANRGYVCSKTFSCKSNEGNDWVRIQTEWTQEGRRFLYNFLKGHGILPLIEKEQE